MSKLPPLPPLLAADEPLPFERLGDASDRRLILVCDHAGNRMPRSLDNLGLAEHHLHDHIAWDIGAAAVVRRLNEWLGGCAVLGVYSRLVVDLNRSLQHEGAFPPISDGILVPGNLGLSPDAKSRRARSLFDPYHQAIDEIIATQCAAERYPVFIGVHSFAPRLHGIERPWHIGVLWDKDPRLPLLLLRALRAHADIVVADNEPYSGRHPADYTIDTHAEPAGLAHIGIEIRQDLIRDEAGQERWSMRIAEALRNVLEFEYLYDPPQLIPPGARA